MNVIDQVADEKLKQDLMASDFADQCKEMRQELGNFQDWERPRPMSVTRLILNPPRGSVQTFNARAHYKGGGIIIYLQIDYSQRPWEVSQIYFSKVRH